MVDLRATMTTGMDTIAEGPISRDNDILLLYRLPEDLLLAHESNPRGSAPVSAVPPLC